MFAAFKKTIGVCLIGLRFGYSSCLITSYRWLAICSRSCHCCSWIDVAMWRTKKYRNKGVLKMTVVVKKVPKFLRGFVKLIFGIKD